MRLLVSGYRHFTNREIIEGEIFGILQNLPTEEHIIIHGGCPTGVDAVAHQVATDHGWTIEVYPAKWKLGRRAGPLRNEQMITEGCPEHAILFLARESKGTKNMLTLVEKHGIPHTIIHLSEDDGGDTTVELPTPSPQE